MNLRSFIGNKQFYKHTLAIAIPIIVQNAVTNLVNLVDNLMVGRLGTEAMSGVSIVNQFVFIFNLAIFGAISGAGIFAAQYSGRGDYVGVRYTMRTRLITCLIVAVGGILIFGFCNEALISSFLHEGVEGDLEQTLAYGKEYVTYLLIGLLPFAISQGYASTLRECGVAVVPMVASAVSVASNCLLNGVLIFGLFGLPALGVVGAAIATTVSRFVELAILVIWTHRHRERCPFAVDLYRSFHVPRQLVLQIIVKGAPMLCNEFLWALSGTVRNQCYSTRGLDVVAAQNIAMTLFNLLSVCYLGLSNAVSIIEGNLLGAGKIEEARDTAKKLLAFSFLSGVVMMLVQIALATIFPSFYNTSEHIRNMATFMLICYAVSMPAASVVTSTYYIIRSGGRVLVTMLFDSIYAWTVMIPTVAVLSYFTDLSIYWIIPLVIIAENIKLIPGLLLVKKGIWARRLDV